VGFNHIITVEDSRKVMDLLHEQAPSVVLLDLSMPYVTGQELLHQIQESFPDVPVVIFTGINDIDTAVECMRAGATDYIVKPAEPQRLISSVKRALDFRELREEFAGFRQRTFEDKLERPEIFGALVTRSPAMRRVFQYIEAVAGTLRPVLIQGESGTGKELLARALHHASGCSGPFVAENVAGLDDSVFSDALFGHRRGAFTGAEDQRVGLIQEAANGTLFLDEIGDLRPESQVKLLRLIQQGEYRPVGDDAVKQCRARLVFTTNRDLNALQASGRFRRDLYYRLNAHEVCLAPLRDRKEDLPLLIPHFLRVASAEMGKRVPRPPAELIQLLATYSFPGNVRELEHLIFNAMAQHEGMMLSLAPFRQYLVANRPDGAAQSLSVGAEENGFKGWATLPTLKEADAKLLEEALDRAGGNQGIAAQLLGISRTSLNKRLHRAQRET
jgi:DNA-binding NtrC family response regulator